MNIYLNGEAKSLPETMNILQLVESLNLVSTKIAVEINREIVPRSLHARTQLKAGDQVELVQAIGGG